ncbi:MAG: inner membrane CreD family protein [Phycisphaerae bacterium]
MTTCRFFAIMLIFGVAAIGWMVLGSTLEYRTASLSSSLGEEVAGLWGPSGLEQHAPEVITAADSRPDIGGGITRSDVSVKFVHHNRYRGLLWFSTYTVEFSGVYGVRTSPQATGGERCFFLKLPSYARTFEGLAVTLDGEASPSCIVQNNANSYIKLPLPQGQTEHEVKVTYQTRGRDRWLYYPNEGSSQGMLRNFTLTATMNFAAIDYPKGSVSPIQPAEIAGGAATAVWKYDNVLMSQPIGIEMPGQPSGGPIAARMSYFAPVSLLFFFTVLFTVMMLKKVPLHPMHYLFISAGFFAFHILMAYLVDLVNIHAAFWASAAVSVLLVASYMRLVAGVKFAVLYTGLAQLVYLIGFSYAFFHVGYTGLSVTIGAIVTLFVLMQATGKVNWNEVFKKKDRPAGWIELPPAGPQPPAGPVPPQGPPPTPGPQPAPNQ